MSLFGKREPKTPVGMEDASLAINAATRKIIRELRLWGKMSESDAEDWVPVWIERYKIEVRRAAKEYLNDQDWRQLWTIAENQ